MLLQCFGRHGQELARHSLIVAFFLKHGVISGILFVRSVGKVPVGVLAHVSRAAIVKGAPSDLGSREGSVLFVQLNPPRGDQGKRSCRAAKNEQ